MAAQPNVDGLTLPLHVSDEDSLMDEGTADIELTPEDVALIAQIRSHEASGRPAQAVWFRSAYGALRATRRASKLIEEAMGNGTTNNGSNGNGNGWSK